MVCIGKILKDCVEGGWISYAEKVPRTIFHFYIILVFKNRAIDSAWNGPTWKVGDSTLPSLYIVGNSKKWLVNKCEIFVDGAAKGYSTLSTITLTGSENVGICPRWSEWEFSTCFCPFGPTMAPRAYRYFTPNIQWGGNANKTCV